MPGWNFADVWEIHAATIGSEPALRQGERTVTWEQMSSRADGVAAALLAAGLDEQAKVAQYLTNCPEYLESAFACFKAGFVPVNTNYRYEGDELVYLWENADCEAIVFHGSFGPKIERLLTRLPRVRLWLWVDDDSAACPSWAIPYESATVSTTGQNIQAPWRRSGDQLFMCYTGGTTGQPKGVMWRQHDFFLTINARLPSQPDRAAVLALHDRPRVIGLPACPLMHATALNTQLGVLSGGGCSVMLEQSRFNPVELLDTLERCRVTQLVIVGDVFANPIADELERHPGRWDLSNLRGITSSGVMFSQEAKQRLLEHAHNAKVIDHFSSSEAVGIGAEVTGAGDDATTAVFRPGADVIVLGEDGEPVLPGSGRPGRVAVGGRQPLGYYKDPIKTASTFVEIDGKRYSFPGDWATIEADGSLRLLGRGSMCINTGGEKVFCEEVEEALKTHPKVEDAVAVGIPDERFGEIVVGVVEPRHGTEIVEADVIAHVRTRLAGFKTPKHIVTVPTLGRAPNGKAAYARLREAAASILGRPLADDQKVSL